LTVRQTAAAWNIPVTLAATETMHTWHSPDTAGGDRDVCQ